MAEEAIDKAIGEYGLKPRNICVTTDVYLLGAKDWTPTMFIKLIQNYGIQREVRFVVSRDTGISNSANQLLCTSAFLCAYR
jgi:glycerol-3-phosphate dehydrogenase